MVRALADTVMVMKDGVVRETGATAKIFNDAAPTPIPNAHLLSAALELKASHSNKRRYRSANQSILALLWIKWAPICEAGCYLARGLPRHGPLPIVG